MEPNCSQNAPAGVEPGPEQPTIPRTRRLARVVRNVSLAVCALSVLAALVLWVVSEHTWWGTLLTFCPRRPFLLPPAVLLAASLFLHRPSILTNLLCLALVGGPLMGGHVRLDLSASPEPGEHALSVVSCNVQEYRPDFQALIGEIAERQPDVVALQEAPYEHELCRRYFPGWHVIQKPNLWIGSRFPLRELVAEPSRHAGPRRLLSVLIETKDGPVILHDVHLPTPRQGLARLSLGSIVSGEGPALVEDSTRKRLEEVGTVRRSIDRTESDVPNLIVGDFNAPTSSNIYREISDGFNNAFDEMGTGFGYTAPCSMRYRWFQDSPWVRIDHILADPTWTVRACAVGRGRGSDHRLIWALVSRG